MGEKYQIAPNMGKKKMVRKLFKQKKHKREVAVIIVFGINAQIGYLFDFDLTKIWVWSTTVAYIK